MKKYILLIFVVFMTSCNIFQEDLNYTVISENKGSSIYENGDSYTIKEPGIYKFTGKTKNGEIIIDVNDKEKVELILDNVNIKNKTGSAITVINKTEVTISLSTNSYNKLSDSKLYSAKNSNISSATIYSKGDLIIKGDGTLEVNGNYNDAIVSKDNLSIISGNVIIKSVDDGIIGKDSITIDGGSIDIDSEGDSLKSDKKDEGSIIINDGIINIKSGDDAIRGYENIIINGGDINISKGYEGIEGSHIIINGGDINIKVTDDGINARYYNQKNKEGNHKKNSLEINGGELYIEVTKGDNFDIHGDITMNNGNVVLNGSKKFTGETLDYLGKFNIYGGSIEGNGFSSPARAPSPTSVQPTIYINFMDKYGKIKGVKNNKIFIIKDSNDKVIKTINPKNMFQYIFLSNKLLKIGETYSYFLNYEKIGDITLEQNLTIVGDTSKMHFNY